MSKLAGGTFPRDGAKMRTAAETHSTNDAEESESKHEDRDQKRKKYHSLAAMALQFAHQAAARGEWVAALEMANGAIFDILEVDDGECAAALPRIIERFRGDPLRELEIARQALEHLLDTTQDYIEAAGLDLNHKTTQRLTFARLRATDVLYPGTTRRGCVDCGDSRGDGHANCPAWHSDDSECHWWGKRILRHG